MKAKTTKILILALAIIVCLSVALYAANSFNSLSKNNLSSVTAADEPIPTATEVTNPALQRID
jgi:hypothetical protein